MKGAALAGVGFLQASTVLAEYVWPSKYDYLEDVMMLHSGYIHNGFSDAVSPCSFGTNVAGRQNAAEWIRTGYHDTATHDAAAGTGGLDASILFELDRDENVGSAFNNTFGFLKNYYNIRASSSDLLALAVITATYRCNGPKIPFRAGRIDATEAGPLGVPKPDEDVETHTNRFATAGFNTSDMIAMVACGHTVGGVHGVDFPEITGNSSETQVSFFEGGDSFGSSAEFDNVVVTQYLNGSTDNPLVSGSNDTTNSDKRVFGADGNTTMHALADPATFQSTCADILERMINAVPSTVTLSEVIEPIDIKPYITTLALNNNGTIDFAGRIRVRVSEGTNRSSNDIAVHLTYAERDGTNASTTITTTHPTLVGGTSSGLFRESFSWYEFTTVLDPSIGISKIHVHTTTPSTGAAQVFDNAGNGFPIDDSLLYQKSQTCLGTVVNGNKNLTVSAFVRSDRIGEAVTLDLVHEVPRQGVIMPALEVRPQLFDKTDTEKSGYVLFQANGLLAAGSRSSTFDVVLGEGDSQTIVENQATSSISTCSS